LYQDYHGVPTSEEVSQATTFLVGQDILFDNISPWVLIVILH